MGCSTITASPMVLLSFNNVDAIKFEIVADTCVTFAYEKSAVEGVIKWKVWECKE